MLRMPRYLVTAGNTREMIDRVRDWGNIFTGNTGFSIARELKKVGDVDLVTSTPQHRDEGAQLGMTPHAFRSHADLLALLGDLVQRNTYDAIYMTAAVADYAPQRVYAVLDRKPGDDGTEQWTVRDAQAGKVKSDHERIAIVGTRTRKIIDCFRAAWGYKNLLVKFKLEVGISPEQLIEIGQRSRRASAAEYLIANTLEMVTGERPGAYLLSEAGARWVARADLAAVAAGLATGAAKE